MFTGLIPCRPRQVAEGGGVELAPRFGQRLEYNIMSSAIVISMPVARSR
jgi:hypothetical protein